jgi:hypothetical protein
MMLVSCPDFNLVACHKRMGFVVVPKGTIDESPDWCKNSLGPRFPIRFISNREFGVAILASDLYRFASSQKVPRGCLLLRFSA